MRASLFEHLLLPQALLPINLTRCSPTHLGVILVGFAKMYRASLDFGSMHRVEEAMSIPATLRIRKHQVKRAPYRLSPEASALLEEFFERSQHRIIRTITDIRKPKDLANMLYAFAEYGSGGTELLSLLQTKLHAKLRDLDTYSLARVLHSFARIADPAVLRTFMSSATASSSSAGDTEIKQGNASTSDSSSTRSTSHRKGAASDKNDSPAPSTTTTRTSTSSVRTTSRFVEQWKVCAAERCHQWWSGHLCDVLWAAAVLKLDHDDFFRQRLVSLLTPEGLERMQGTALLYPFLRLAADCGGCRGSEDGMNTPWLKALDEISLGVSVGQTPSNADERRSSNSLSSDTTEVLDRVFPVPGFGLFADDEEYERYCNYVRSRFWKWQARLQRSTPGYESWARQIRAIFLSDFESIQLAEYKETPSGREENSTTGRLDNMLKEQDPDADGTQQADENKLDIVKEDTNTTVSDGIVVLQQLGCCSSAQQGDKGTTISSGSRRIPYGGLEWSNGNVRLLLEENKDLEGFLVDFFVTVLRKKPAPQMAQDVDDKGALVEEEGALVGEVLEDDDLSAYEAPEFHCLLFHSNATNLHRHSQKPLGHTLLRQRFIKRVTTCHILNIQAENWMTSPAGSKVRLIRNRILGNNS
ncbi:unnamed protein product [Amoebophrya sp. A25]|nr:unnamed protein product [Amoebophrya sp. A25]|eukprot:GSA25T00026030001.1